MHTQIQSLFNQVSTIVQKYEKIAELTGENFNVFRILRLSTYEVRTHSAFIAELLNPTGSHGQKGKFLKLFTEQLNIEGFDCEKAKIEVEKHISFISEDGKEGGNIDVIAISSNQAIIIENKIYAGDQKYQLLRYYNYGIKQRFSRFDLLYLTLDGKEPSEHSKGKLKENEDYCLISYQTDILEWLEKCVKEPDVHPVVEKIIFQYIFLIKFLTNQSTNTIMKEEIVKEIISKEAYIKALFEIQKEDVVEGVQRNLIAKLKTQMEELSKDFDLQLEFDEEQLGTDVDGTDFKFHLKNSKKGFYIGFGFCYLFHNMVYVVHCEEEHAFECKDEVCRRIGNRTKEFNEIWVDWFEDKFRYWDNSPDPWLAILSGELKDNIRSKIGYILNALKGYDI